MIEPIPERALWRAVLRLAIADMAVPGFRAAAMRWIDSQDSHAGSFLWICDMTEIDPRDVRRRVISRQGRDEMLGRTKPRITAA